MDLYLNEINYKEMEELHWQNKNWEDIEGEKWIAAFGYEDVYEVSNKGRVKSLSRYVQGPRVMRLLKGRILSQAKIKHGDTFSLFVNLANGDRTYSIKTVASLILNSFRTPDEYNDTIHHINGISFDNRLKNLTFEDLSTKRKIEFDMNIRDRVKAGKRLEPYRVKYQEKSKSAEEVRQYLKKSREIVKPRKVEQRKKTIITVFLEKTREIGTYSSFRNASEQLGIDETKLRNCYRRSDRYSEIQVRKGALNLEEFNPIRPPKILRIKWMGNSYKFLEFSRKFNIPLQTLYQKYRNEDVLLFYKWIQKRLEK